MKKITKKQAAAFAKDAQALFARLGFTPAHGGERLRAMTRHGVYSIHPPDADMDSGGYTFDLIGRFETPDRRTMPSDANPYSGKWNLHGYTAAGVLAEFATRMQMVGARAMTPEEASTAQAMYEDGMRVRPPTPPPPLPVGPAPTRPPTFHPAPLPAQHPAIALARDLAAALRSGLPQWAERLALAELTDSPAMHPLAVLEDEKESLEADLEKAEDTAKELERDSEKWENAVHKWEALFESLPIESDDPESELEAFRDIAAKMQTLYNSAV